MSRIGILGGTFNPIHFGHIELAQIAMKECLLDSMIIMPSGISYLKADQKIPDGACRLEMCRIALEGIKDFNVSDLEVLRKGNTYTYETLSQLKKIYPEDLLYFIVGADSLFNIANWKKPELIFSACTLVCSQRGSEKTKEELIAQAQKLEDQFKANIKILDAIPDDISSTQVRTLFAGKADRSEICNYIPESLYNYINDHKLYN